jgi:hypothetical protein
MLRATLNEPVPLQIFVPDGRTDLFARVRVLDIAGATADTLFPLHQSAGLYSVNWVPPAEGYFSAIYDLYVDPALMTPADYESSAEVIEVSSDKTNIARLLGLHHENSLLDQQVYTTNGRLASARLRMYDSAASLAAASATSPAGGTAGLLYTWTVSATYDPSNQSKTFQIAREP